MHFEPRARAIETTMLDLVEALSRDTDDEAEVVEAVRELLESGRVRLIGIFRDGSPEDASRGSQRSGPLLTLGAEEGAVARDSAADVYADPSAPAHDTEE